MAQSRPPLAGSACVEQGQATGGVHAAQRARHRPDRGQHHPAIAALNQIGHRRRRSRARPPGGCSTPRRSSAPQPRQARPARPRDNLTHHVPAHPVKQRRIGARRHPATKPRHDPGRQARPPPSTDVLAISASTGARPPIPAYTESRSATRPAPASPYTHPAATALRPTWPSTHAQAASPTPVTRRRHHRIRRHYRPHQHQASATHHSRSERP
jgi:hypothetical protein